MEKITVSEVRDILLEVLDGYVGLCESIVRTPDEKFLKTNIRDEYGIDSLDFEEMFNILEKFYGIVIDVHNSQAESLFYKEPTVENFIKAGNYYLRHN